MLSDTAEEVQNINKFKGLNPCSNGICSLTLATDADGNYATVLILVLMEYAL